MLAPPSRRLVRRLLLLLLVIVAAGGSAAWWYRSTRPDARLQRGRDAIRRGDWDTVDRLSDRLEGAGETDRANLLRGEALAARERWLEALETLNKILDEGDLRLQAAVTVGRCLLEEGDRREAYRVFSFVLSEDKDNVDAHRGMAAIAFDLGNLTTALFHLDEIARLDDSDGRSYRMRGQCLAYLNREEESVEAYRQALERTLSPEWRKQALLELAERLVKLYRYTQALPVLDERKGTGEDDLSALALRAEALVNLRRMDEAERLLDRGLGDYPESAPLWAMRGQIYFTTNQTPEAIHAFEQAVKYHAGDYQYRYQLANAYARAGRKKDEQLHREKAAELRQALTDLSDLSREAMRKPWDEEIRLKLAGLCTKIHDNRLAGMWYKAAEACKKPSQ